MKKILSAIAMLLLSCASGNIVHAQDIIMDDVETSTESEWVRIKIHFTLPINYLRHFPQERGQLLQIFFNIAGLDSQNVSLREEIRNVPPTPVMPSTTLTYEPPLSLNLQRDPSTLLVRFDHAVNYDVRPGEDHRSLVIYLPIVPIETNPSGVIKDKPVPKDNSTK